MALSKKKQRELREEKTMQQVDNAVLRSEKFLEKYKNQIFYVVLGFVVIAIGFMAYKRFYVEPRNNKAQVAMFIGEQYYAMGYDSLALFGDANGYIGFEAIVEQYGSTKGGDLAKAYAGICHARLSNYDQAISYLSKFEGGDKLFTYQAKVTLGDCYVNTGDLDKAAKLYEEAAKKADNDVYSPIYYQKAGMVYRELKNHDKVIDVFTKIKNNYMNSMVAADADKYIEEANLLKGAQ